jgi:Flp pilus assembly pilin Flp
MLQQLVRDDRGQDLVEYALIIAALALALIASVSQLSQSIASVYTSITGTLTGIEWQQAQGE